MQALFSSYRKIDNAFNKSIRKVVRFHSYYRSLVYYLSVCSLEKVLALTKVEDK